MALVNPATTREAVARQLRGGRADIAGLAFRALLLVALLVTVGILGILILDVWTGGWSVLSERLGSFLTGTLSSRSERAGVFQGIRGSFWIAMFTIVLAFPLGIGAAIYLEEYAPNTRFARVVDVNIRNLAGVPSVVYGILGLTIFVKVLGSFTGGRTVMAAGITLAILVLPIVIITSAEAIRSVPSGLREAGFGVGATRWEVIRHHVLPYAAPGILTGTVLSLARALGEAAPLILVGATTDFLGGGRGSLLDFGQLTERFTALPIIITTWAGRPQTEFRSLTAAAIVVLLVVVLLFNAVAILLRNRYEKRRR
ncbi:MAG TPA: phosphate ABC transporter permease PstA [Acidimicrobiales bacterium]|nr:phosphate ABC transporter permease PstA [Acidimicrobiales bacterium]